MGNIPNQWARTPTTAAYAVDGGPLTTFALKGLTDKQPTLFNQKFFETPWLELGPHRVLVVYQGNSDTTPLTLTNVFIEGGNATNPLPEDPSIFPPGSSLSPSPSEAGSNEKKAPIGAIVGGVAGGLAIIAAAIFAAWFMIRRRKSKERARANMQAVPFDSIADLPSTLSPSTFEKDRGYGNNNNHPTPVYAAQHGQVLGQGAAARSGHGPMPSGSTEWTYDGSTSHGHRPLVGSPGPSPSMLVTNASNAGPNMSPTHLGRTNMGAFAQPLRKGQIMLEAREHGSPGYTGVPANDARVVLHEDSGVRMDAQGNMIEFPPSVYGSVNGGIDCRPML